MVQRRQLTFSVNHLYPLVALAAFVSIGALIPIDQVDFWWHLALGRDITRLGAIPTTSSHSWILPPNTPFIYGSWLSEWLFYQLYLMGGLSLIVVTRNVLLFAAYAVVGVEARRRSGSWRLAAAAIAGAGLITLNNITIRPQMFAWVLFALTMLLVGAFRAGQLRARWLLAVPLMMVVWTNLHGSFVLGVGLLGVTLGAEMLSYMLRRPQRLATQHLVWLTAITLLSILAMLINPEGFGIITFVGKLAGHRAAREFGGEWQPPTLTAFPGILLPLSLALAALGWVRKPQRFNLTDAALLAAFAVLGISSIRNLIWFGMISAPIVAGIWRREHPVRTQQQTQFPLVNYSIALLICAPLIVVQPPFKANLSLPPALSGLDSSVPEGPMMEVRTPVRAVDWLAARALPSEMRLFHDMIYGSYLIWALPNIQVCMDGRIELYSYEQWLRYQRIVNGEDSLTELSAMGATHALLSHEAESTLINILSQPDSGWRQLYSDDQAVIFERTGTSS